MDLESFYITMATLLAFSKILFSLGETGSAISAISKILCNFVLICLETKMKLECAVTNLTAFII